MLQGGHAANKVSPDEPKPLPPSDCPPAPDYLTPLARQEWEAMALPLYNMGVLTEVDLGAFAAYCAAYGDWRKAEADVRQAAREAAMDPADKTFGGTLIETTNGNLVQNPIVGVRNKARAAMVRLGQEFGLTPASRTAIQVKGGREADPLSSRYFGGA